MYATLNSRRANPRTINPLPRAVDLLFSRADHDSTNVPRPGSSYMASLQRISTSPRSPFSPVPPCGSLRWTGYPVREDLGGSLSGTQLKAGSVRPIPWSGAGRSKRRVVQGRARASTVWGEGGVVMAEHARGMGEPSFLSTP